MLLMSGSVIHIRTPGLPEVMYMHKLLRIILYLCGRHFFVDFFSLFPFLISQLPSAAFQHSLALLNKLLPFKNAHCCLCAFCCCLPKPTRVR